ncbi:MAG TPA: CBS domain-containing protein [Methylophilaceae bacterium]|jgi:CBS domain-containing protein
MKTVRQVISSRTGPVVSITSNTTVYDALVIMAEKRIGALLVIDDDKLNGILSERDYVRSMVVSDKTPKATPVSDIMTTAQHLITVSPKNTIEECLNLVSTKRIRHLPVVEGGKVVGILSIGDLVKETIEYQQSLIKQLESYIQG